MVDKSQKDIKEKDIICCRLSEILRAYAAEVTDKKKGDD